MDAWIWTILLGLVLVVLLFKSRGRNLPPGPAGWPFIGTLGILGPDMYINLQQMGEQYGDVFSFYIANRLTVVLSSAKAVKEAFIKQRITFAGRPYPWVMKLVDVQEVINNGTYTEEWKAERKFILLALRKFGFGSGSLEDKMKNELNTLLDIYRNQDGKPFDPREYLPKTLANLVFSILINVSYSYDSSELNKKLTLIQRWQEQVGEANILDIFPVLRFFPWAPMKRLKLIRDEITAEFRKHVEEHKETFNPEYLRDVIDVYLKERGKEYDTEKLVGTFFSFTGDATDSLPESIVWILLYITSFPEVQSKIQNEITKITKGDREVCLDDRTSMPYMESVIMESLRMSSFVPISEPHTTLEDTTLMGYDIPKNANVLANLYAVHMEESVWGDPQVFRPERFLDESGALLRNEAFMPFSVGRRVCLGEQLSNKVMFLFTSVILQNFRLTFPPDSTPPTLQAQRWYVRKAPVYKLCAISRR